MSLLLILVTFIISNVVAWGTTGHIVVGLVAQAQLNDNGKAMVADILSKYTGPTGARFKDLGSLAPYADVLRDYYPWASNLHFINVKDGELNFVPLRDCSNNFCLYGGINNYTKYMFSTRNDNTRGEALMFLTHFFGDLAQPLHVSHASDKGGNSIKVNLASEWLTEYKNSNLHHVWDSDSIFQWQRTTGMSKPEQLSNWIANNLINDQAKQKYKKVSDITTIADDTYNIALNEAYELAKGLDLNDFPISYYNQTIATIQNQLMAGGLRLAAWLNKIADTY